MYSRGVWEYSGGSHGGLGVFLGVSGCPRALLGVSGWVGRGLGRPTGFGMSGTVPREFWGVLGVPGSSWAPPCQSSASPRPSLPTDQSQPPSGRHPARPQSAALLLVGGASRGRRPISAALVGGKRHFRRKRRWVRKRRRPEDVLPRERHRGSRVTPVAGGGPGVPLGGPGGFPALGDAPGTVPVTLGTSRCPQISLEHEILLHPRYFGPNLLNTVKQKLFTEVEGTCTGK